MNARHAHLVGSLPFDSEREAMEKALRYLGPHLLSLPDGEVGEKTSTYPKGTRQGWITAQVQRCADSGAFQVLREIVREPERGLQKDYQSGYLLKASFPPERWPSHLTLGYRESFEKSYPVFAALRREHGLESLRFQVGVPAGLDITMTSMQPEEAVRYAPAFNRQIALEVNAIAAAAAGEVVVQIEVPVELGMVVSQPETANGLPLQSILSLVDLLNPAVPVGIHLCLGDLNNRALTRLSTTGHLVRMSNLLVQRWPHDHPLAFIHYPLAEGQQPPRSEEGFYAPLAELQLPESSRMIAGFVHEGASEAELGRILAVVEAAVGRRVDVASSCGLGRRKREVAEELLRRTARLAGSAP